MKIGLVCPYNIYLGGGVQECVLAMQAELQKRGHEVWVITPQPRELPKSHPREGVIFLGGGTEVKSFRTRAQVSASVNIDRLQEVLDTYNFDILHFHEPWVPMVSRQILTRSHSINVATFHAKLPDTVMHRTIERVITPYTKSILNYLDAFTAVSDAAATYVRDLTPETVQIIPNGIDLQIYEPAKEPPKDPTILYIGRLEKRKGVKYLLKAMQKLSVRLPNAKLLIAGDGPDREKLESYVKDVGLKNVEFLGYISQAKKLKLLQQARVFCSPALYGESFGIVLLEAMACGTPVIAGDNPGYSAVLKEQAKISLVNPKKADIFAAHLEYLLTDDEAQAAWRNWALEYVKQFNYSNVIDAYEEMYKGLHKSV